MSASAREVFMNLPADQQEALAAAALAAKPVAYLSLFENTRRREGKQDSQYQGRLDLTVSRLTADLAEAQAKGHTNLQYYFDLWVQHDGSEAGPILQGRARNKVGDDKRFMPIRQTTEDTASEAPEDGPAS